MVCVLYKRSQHKLKVVCFSSMKLRVHLIPGVYITQYTLIIIVTMVTVQVDKANNNVTVLFGRVGQVTVRTIGRHSVMNLFQLFTSLDRLTSRILGFRSPWSHAYENTSLYLLYTVIPYAAPLLSFCYLNSRKEHSKDSVDFRLSNSLRVSYVFEMYLNIIYYGCYNKTSAEFVAAVFRNIKLGGKKIQTINNDKLKSTTAYKHTVCLLYTSRCV